MGILHIWSNVIFRLKDVIAWPRSHYLKSIFRLMPTTLFKQNDYNMIV